MNFGSASTAGSSLSDEIEKDKRTFQDLNIAKSNVLDNWEDLNRQIPQVAADSLREIEKYRTKTKCLAAETASLRAEISNLKEDLEAEKLNSTILDNDLEMNEMELDLLQDRVQELVNH